MEEVSGTKLEWFFRQWLYRAGSPVVEGSWKYNPGSRRWWRWTWRRRRAGEAFRLPLEIGVGRSKVVKVELTERRQRFEIAVEGEPAAVELDPNTWVLMDARFGRAQ